MSQSADLKQAEVDPDISIDSIQHLIPTAAEETRTRSRRSYLLPIPTPSPFKQKSAELRKLRCDQIWKTGMWKEQVALMEEWFPDSYAKNSCDKNKLLDRSKIRANTSAIELTILDRAPVDNELLISDIGDFRKLPGELRNRIYRIAILLDGPVKVNMEAHTCSFGPCRHRNVSYNVPGVAQTCRQMRWEVMSIYCSENVVFEFDGEVVRQRCVGNFLTSIGDYADSIAIFRFAVMRSWTSFTFALTAPKVSEHAIFKLIQHENGGERVCQCKLDQLVTTLNLRKDSVPSGRLALEFANSDELSDFVWRMRKYGLGLAKCRTCSATMFIR